ncbi:MAG: SulP family inorganic anion transporter [Sandaracinaceae bacterium]|nr:SulP family inorganic anion transporter [Sandaracinaceae bacterium]
MTARPSGALASLDLRSIVRHDLAASVVVFLVALPLCLGIAHASGAPLAAGLVTGIVGGVVVGLLSGSSLSVSGPAAGLTVVVLSALDDLGSFGALLLATSLAGLLQLGLAALRAGRLAQLFPSPVIRGLLAAIGAILVLKELPHALGWVGDFSGDLEFTQADGRNTFSEIPFALGHVHPGAAITALVALSLLIAKERVTWLKDRRWLPGPLLAVGSGAAIHLAFSAWLPSLAVPAGMRIELPQLGGELFHAPDLSRWNDPTVLRVGFTIAVIASIETLLCVEAVDRLDPEQRRTPPNRELVAQGLGNLVAGLLGGIPMTAVIVRGSANVQSGGRSKASSIMHGLWLLLAVAIGTTVLSHVPLSALAAILIHIGFKLTPPSLFRHMRALGWEQWAPFGITFVGILVTDLLIGVTIGLVASVALSLRRTLAEPLAIARDDVGVFRVRLARRISFLSRATVRNGLESIEGADVIVLDGTELEYADRDVVETLHDFARRARERGVDVQLQSIPQITLVPAH